MNIALVEDDSIQSTLISHWLDSAGYTCNCYNDTESFKRSEEMHQLLLLDWELPDHNGLELLEWVRNRHGQYLLVMFLTMRNKEEDIVQALRSGADDYLIKPAREQELLARIEALMRRSNISPTANGTQTIGPFTINQTNRLLQHNGEPIELTHKEYALSCYLLSNIGKLLTRQELMENVWGYAKNLNTRTVDTHISRVRKKLSLLPKNGWQLSAIYQYGYRLDYLAGQ